MRRVNFSFFNMCAFYALVFCKVVVFLAASNLTNPTITGSMSHQVIGCGTASSPIVLTSDSNPGSERESDQESLPDDEPDRDSVIVQKRGSPLKVICSERYR